MNIFWINLPITFILLQVSQSSDISYDVVEIFKRPGDVNLVLLEECDDETDPSALRATRINSAIWTVDRLNVLETTTPLSLGLEIYDVCHENQYYDTIYRLFRQQERKVTVGIVTPKQLPMRVRKFCELLNIHQRTIKANYKHIIRATVELLSALNWKNNVVVIVQEKSIVEEVLRLTRKSWICVSQMMDVKEAEQIIFVPNVAYVIMGDGYTVNNLLKESSGLRKAKNVILVAVDGSKLYDIPGGFYLIENYNENVVLNFTQPAKIVPAPILFDFADPFVHFARSLALFLRERCNNTVDLITCVGEKYYIEMEDPTSNSSQLLDFLQIEPLRSKFNYEVFVSENSSSMTKLASYNVFQEAFVEINDNAYFEKYINNSDDKDCTRLGIDCSVNCLNLWSSDDGYSTVIKLRPEAWVYAFLAISFLGIIFCVAIGIFIITRLSKKQILEGNPTLTFLLLIVVVFMYFSIIPFAIDGDNEVKATIFLIRSFCLALPYTAAFSLILSRVILLATVTKEVGFMSHVAGSVQTFLTLFIFGVQCALSLQIVRKCDDVFHTVFILYLLSYNIVLLLLLLCLSPLITRSQRNYKEGRYFTIATILIAFNWCCWVPGYVALNEYWKDPMLCIGLVGTASVLVGTVFIPRTYLITVSAARDRFSNALPTLAAMTNTLDIYRASTQYSKAPISATTSSKFFKKPGDVNMVLLEGCVNETNPSDLRTTRINSAIWTVDRLNVLQTTTPLSLGLEIYDVCHESQYYDTIYRLFRQQERKVTVGIVTPKQLPARVRKFCELLNIHQRTIKANYKHIIRATVELLSALNWKNNVVVIVQEKSVVEEVLRLIRKSWICVSQAMDVNLYTTV